MSKSGRILVVFRESKDDSEVNSVPFIETLLLLYTAYELRERQWLIRKLQERENRFHEKTQDSTEDTVQYKDTLLDDTQNFVKKRKEQHLY